MLPSRLAALLTPICCVFVTARISVAEISTGLPPDVEASLVRQSKELQPISLTWTEQSYEPAWIGDTSANPLFHSRADELMRLQGNKIYWRSTTYESMDADATPRDSERSYDGSVVYIGQMGKAVLTKQDPVSSKGLFSTFLLSDAGYEIVGTAGLNLESSILKDIRDGDSVNASSVGLPTGMLKIDVKIANYIRHQAEKADLVRVAEGLRKLHASDAAVERRLAALRYDRLLPATLNERFLISTEMGCVLVRREIISDSGVVLERVVNSDFQQLEHRKLWLPHRTQKSVVWPATGVFPAIESGHSCTLQSVNCGPIQSKDFVLDYLEPGTLIVDNTSSGRGYEHTVPLSQSQLEQATTRAEREVLPTGNQTDQSRGWFFMGIASIVLALGMVAAWLVLRVRQSQ